MKISQEEVDQFAQKAGYEYAVYRIEWKGYSCYELCFKGMDDMKIGPPWYVLVDSNGKMRLAKDEKMGDEIEQIYDAILHANDEMHANDEN